jgi:hypothetical protein
MEGERFDAIARTMVGTTRRRAVRLLGGGALGGALLLVERNDAAARCPHSRRCGKHHCCPKGQLCGDKATNLCVTGAGTCPKKSDICAGIGEDFCGGGAVGSCWCVQSTTGATRCANSASINCANACSDDAACASLSPTAFCANVVGAGCCASPACALPCPS